MSNYIGMDTEHFLVIAGMFVIISIAFVGWLFPLPSQGYRYTETSLAPSSIDVRNVGYMPTQYEVIKLNEDGSIYSKENTWK